MRLQIGASLFLSGGVRDRSYIMLATKGGLEDLKKQIGGGGALVLKPVFQQALASTIIL